MSIDFFIDFGVFFIFFGSTGFLFALAYCKSWKGIVLAVLVSIIISTLVGYAGLVEDNRNEKNWNNGYCPTCGIHWTFSGGSHYRSNIEYYYTCENCHTVIETSHIMK